VKLEEQNKQVIRTLLEATDRADFGLVQKCYHERFIEHNPHSAVHAYQGRKGVEEAFQAFHKLFPIRKHLIEDIIAEGDKVAARITFTANLPVRLISRLQSQEFKVTSTTIYRLERFKIIEKWTQVSVLKELGLTLNDITTIMNDTDQTNDVR
jgi:predicted SnoaL-like aldol condensation-catalyzing enzyme